MCITFFFIPSESQQVEMSWPFLLFFNREENIFRKTISASSPKKNKNLIFSQDLWSNGTWLSVNRKTGNFAFLTNLNEVVKSPFDSSKRPLFSLLAIPDSQTSVLEVNWFEPSWSSRSILGSCSPRSFRSFWRTRTGTIRSTWWSATGETWPPFSIWTFSTEGLCACAGAFCTDSATICFSIRCP